MLARARHEPDVSTETESLLPDGAGEGTDSDPTGALPYDDYDSKIAFNCTTI